MSYDELLELKKEIDELSLYYGALKEKSKEIDEIFYSNNLTDLDSDDTEDDLDDEDSIDEQIDKNRRKYTFDKLIGYWVRYSLFLIIKTAFDLPAMLYSTIVIINLAYYMVAVFGYERIMRKKLESKEEKKEIDFETLAEQKRKVDKNLEYVREKYVSASAEYERLINDLNHTEYLEYLEYISEYLKYMLENSEELLTEVQENCENIDMADELGEDSHTYRLN